MSIARPCPYSEEKEFCKYETYCGQPRFDKCSTCSRMKKEQIYWIVKLTKPDGEVGYMNYNHDITTSFKYVATFLTKEQVVSDVARHTKNTSRNSTQVKYWLKDKAVISYVQLSMCVKD